MAPRYTRTPAVLAAVAMAAGTAATAGALATGACDAAAPGGPAGRLVSLVCALGLLLSIPAALTVAAWRRLPRTAARGAGTSAAVAADLALLAGLAVAGGLHYTAHRWMVPQDHVATISDAGRTALYGRILEVRRSSTGAVNVVLVARARGDPSRADSVPWRASGLVWARWPYDAPVPSRGERVTLAGTLSAPWGHRNPGDFDFRAWLRDRGVHRTLMHCELTGREPTERPDASDWVAGTIARHVPGVNGRLLTGLLLGRSNELPTGLGEAFRRSGTVHILAVSGLHVGFVVLIAHALLRSLRVPRKLARLLVLPVLACFVVVVGPRPSVLRASTMAAFLLTAPTIERAPNSLNSLGAAALALMIARPGCLFDLGFRLSFSAVTGIVFLYGPISSLLKASATRGGGRLGRVWTAVGGAVALSLSAQAGVAPVLIRAFGRISVIAPVANLAAVPLAGLSVASGFAVLAAAPAGSWPASAFAAVSWAACGALIRITEAFGGLPWSGVDVPARVWPAVLGAVVGLTLLLRARTRSVRILGVAAVFSAVLAGCSLGLTGPGRTWPRVVFFDVGQGDSTLLELPWRRYVLVDAGPGPGILSCAADSLGTSPAWMPRDAGADVVVPYLRREGISRLRALVVTHGHADHYGGAASVLGAVTVDTLVLPRGRADNNELAGLLELAESRGTAVIEVERGCVMTFGGTELAVLSPDSALAEHSSENDASVVLRTGLGGVGVLLTGDIERSAEGALCRSVDELGADVLKVPHHGSSTSSTGEFLERVRPAAGVVQVGAGNSHGHPDEATLGRLGNVGAVIFRTDLDGAVVISWRLGHPEIRCVASGRAMRLR